MSFWIQNIIVLLIVGVAVGAVLRQLMRTLGGQKSRLGACCSRGCPTSHAKAKKATPQIAFVPVELLIRHK